MKTKHDFFTLFQRFVKNSYSGRRSAKDGKRIKPCTVDNYIFTEKLLREFCMVTNFELTIPEINNNNKRKYVHIKNYWKNFNRNFSDFLYNHKGLYDNYVGTTYKNIRTFLSWVKTEKGINAGEFHKSFYIPKQEIPILTLTCDQLKFLIYDEEFNNKLTAAEKIDKDILIFGCTCGLRYSDLKELKTHQIEKRGESIFLRTKSIKTAIDTSIKLPSYAVEIVAKFKCKKGFLLPCKALQNFNVSIKKIFEKAGWIQPVAKIRTRNGKICKVSNVNNPKNEFRFCDLASSHIMRRTAITTLLTLGVPELIVKKISGHSNNSRSFYRYVNFAQELMDTEIEKAFNKIIIKS